MFLRIYSCDKKIIAKNEWDRQKLFQQIYGFSYRSINWLVGNRAFENIVDLIVFSFELKFRFFFINIFKRFTIIIYRFAYCTKSYMYGVRNYLRLKIQIIILLIFGSFFPCPLVDDRCGVTGGYSSNLEVVLGSFSHRVLNGPEILMQGRYIFYHFDYNLKSD